LKKLKWIVALMIGAVPAMTGEYLNAQEHAPCADFYYIICADFEQQCNLSKPCSFSTLGTICDRGWEDDLLGSPGMVLSNQLPNSGLGLYMGNVQGIQEGEYRCGTHFDCLCRSVYVSLLQWRYECSQKVGGDPWNWPDYPYLELCPPPPGTPPNSP
jgi:hypothetical protein